MSINCINRDKLEQFMKDNLKPSRYKHSLGVEKMATHLAKIYNADVEKAAFAGRYHDIAKCFDRDKMDEYIKKYDIPEKYLGNIALAHSKVAAAILENEYGVDDQDILNAVKSHTTGRVGMSLLEEIVYVSDAIEENRNYPELKMLQDESERDLDKTCLYVMDFAVQMILEKGRELDSDTLEAREYIKEKIRRKNGQ